MVATESLGPRPVVFEYASIAQYLSAMLAWHRRATPAFSIRSRLLRYGTMSHTQISRLSSGKRRLTRELVGPLAEFLELSGEERVYLDRWVKADREGMRHRGASSERQGVERAHTVKMPRPRRAQNHLLSDWLNVYVRDAVKLKNFKPSVPHIYRLLSGIASPRRIERALTFLLREGFLRRTLTGELVQDEVVVTSSDGIPNAKIRAFHKQALAIARRNLDLLPVEKRQEAAMVLHLNPASVAELRQLLKEFYERLLQFAEERPGESEGLYQVLLNLTPISAPLEGAPHEKV